MTIPKLTPYTGQVANPDGSQTQSEFTQSMFDQLSYEAQLATELDATVDGINQAVTDVEGNANAASASANAAEAAASTAGYKGLWPDTGGSALKGETWQTQTGGTPTGDYYTALQNTTVDPVGDNVNWKYNGDRFTDVVNVLDYHINGEDDWTAAFQRAVDLNPNAHTITCPNNIVMRIDGTVDMKRKALVMVGYAKALFSQSEKGVIQAGPSHTGTMFKNITTTMAVHARGNGISGCNFCEFDGDISTGLGDAYLMDVYGEYNNFNTVLYVPGICVDFSWYANCNTVNYALRVEDAANRVSTTIYMHKTATIQWSNYGFVFGGNVFGSDIHGTFEAIKEQPLQARWWQEIDLSGAWFEGNQNQPWQKSPILGTLSNQSLINITVGSNTHYQSGWVNPIAIGEGSNGYAHGVSMRGPSSTGRVTVSTATGSQCYIDEFGIHSDGDQYVSEEQLSVIIDAANPRNNSFRKGSVILSPGSGGGDVIYRYTDNPQNFYSGMDKYVAGSDGSGNTVYNSYRHTSSSKMHNGVVRTIDSSSNVHAYKSGIPLYIVWDSDNGLAGAPLIGAYTFTETSTGILRLQIDNSGGVPMTSPALSVSGIFSSEPLLHRVVPVEKYGGSWSLYKDPAAFDFHFTDTSGNYVTPDRFTVTLMNLTSSE